MQIVQGARDYQVTVDHDLRGWREGLSGRDDVTVHIIPAADHLFFAGEGRSTPADYEVPRHVDQEAIEVIAQ